MVKAIETVYNGYRFRSRLEARWAVFFDTIGIEYQYEPEGFDLDGIWYLPDFYIARFDCYIEIKPEHIWPTDKVHFKETGFYHTDIYKTMRRFADSVRPIICFGGLPNLGVSGIAFCHDTTDSSGGSYENSVGFSYCHNCNRISLSMSDDDIRFIRGRRELHNWDWKKWNIGCDPEHRRRHTISELDKAILSAKQARFGKNGRG